MAILAGSGWGQRSDDLAVYQNPDFVLSLGDGKATLGVGKDVNQVDDFFREMSEMLRKGYSAVGYFGYEFFRHLLSLDPGGHKDGMTLPDAAFMFFKRPPSSSAAEGPRALFPKAKLRPNVKREEFLRMVERTREYIAAGDVYQVNISQRFDVERAADPLQAFFNLRRVQPTPFSCFLDFSDFQLLSGSMELFLRKRGRQLITRPIKGTRPRGNGLDEDKRLRAELGQSEKERAENLMIVDLMRNDFGKVCEFGSVGVTRLFEVEGYSTLYQMFSEVVGRIGDETGLYEILAATFPPGSVTGAPKIRAMEIIDELEPHLRGPYCGALAFFRPNGDFDMSVAIRVMALQEGDGSFWVGGGITWGSDPQAEYEETLVKARAMQLALEAGL